MTNSPKLMVYTVFALSFFLLSEAMAAPQPLDSKDLPNRDGIKVGDIIIHGAFKASEELETNIFLDNDKPKFDAITILSPSVGIEIPLQDNKLSADYEAGIFIYSRYPTEDHIDHRARALAEINLTDYRITVNDLFRDYTDRAADENSMRIGRQFNNLRAGIEAQFDQLGFDVGYTNLIETYSQKDDILYQTVTYGDKDRISNIVDGTLSYRIMPKTALFLEGDLGFINYYTSSLPPDSYYINAFLGIKGKLTNKIPINLKAGLRYQSYETSVVLNDKDYIGPIASGGLDFLATKDDTVSFGIEKRLYESTYQNNNYYDVTLTSLKYLHKFNKKLSISPFGYYQLSLYPGETVEGSEIAKRYDNLFGGGCSVRYDIRKWASAEARYEYVQRISRFSNYDYADNRVTFSGTVGF